MHPFTLQFAYFIASFDHLQTLSIVHNSYGFRITLIFSLYSLVFTSYWIWFYVTHNVFNIYYLCIVHIYWYDSVSKLTPDIICMSVWFECSICGLWSNQWRKRCVVVLRVTLHFVMRIAMQFIKHQTHSHQTHFVCERERERDMYRYQ